MELLRRHFRYLVLSAVSIPYVFILGCAPTRFFYYPNKVLYADPHNAGLDYQIVNFPSLNGVNLTALLFLSTETPKGTVLHFHGNFGNVSNHYPQSVFLLKYGFDVLVLDYQGFGGSDGSASPKRTMEDGIAAVRYVRDHHRDLKGNIALFGQSLGGAVACVVAAQEREVRAVVLEATFTSYRSIARKVLGKSPFLWIFYPIYPLLLPTAYDPISFVGKISPTPLLFIHGTNDEIIPLAMSRQNYEKAGTPKELWEVQGAHHLGCQRLAPETYQKKIVAFLEKAFRQ